MIVKEDNSLNKYIAGFLIIALGVLIFLGLNEFLNAFLGSIIFYVLFKNFMRKLTGKYKLNNSLAAVIILLISFIIVVLPIGFLFGMIYNKAATVMQDPEQVKQFIATITDRMQDLPIKTQAKSMGEKVAGFITSHVGDVLSSSLSIFASLAIMYFFLYFFLINENKLEAKLVYYLPFQKDTCALLGRELNDQTRSNAIGMPIIAVIQGLITYGGYLIAGVPDAPMWATITGCATILPIIGTAIIWIPIGTVLLVTGNTWQGIFIFAFCAIVVGTVDNLIRMIISKKVGDVHPIITVLGIIFGLKFFNLPGLVFGPLLLSYFMIFLRMYYTEYTKGKILESDAITIKTDKDHVTNVKIVKRRSNPKK